MVQMEIEFFEQKKQQTHCLRNSEVRPNVYKRSANMSTDILNMDAETNLKYHFVRVWMPLQGFFFFLGGGSSCLYLRIDLCMLNYRICIHLTS